MTERIYISVYSLKEQKERLNEFYALRGKDKDAYYKRPENKIYEYDENGKLISIIYETDEKLIYSFSYTENKSSCSFMNSQDELIYTYIFENNIFDKPITLNPGYMWSVLSPDGKGLYYKDTYKDGASSVEINAVYYYDLATKNVTEIFHYPNAWISNFYIHQ